MKDYYKILGIEKGASKDDIKKAFRGLASKYHPDKKTGDEAKFKEVSEAYSVLSDDSKRAQYDAYGQSYPGGGGAHWGGFGGGQGGFEFDINDIFQNFGDMFGGFDVGMGQRHRQRGNDISVDIELSFRESVFGTKRTLRLAKHNTCTACKGTGAEGSETVTCTTCNGNGKIRESRQSIMGSVMMVRECPDCKGRGAIPKKKCHECHGSGVRKGDEEIAIDIPAGIENGEMIRMTGRGEAIQGGVTGDLYIKIHVAKHHHIIREGANLIMKHPVKLTDALLGAHHDIETLDGTVNIKIPEGITHGEMLRIKGKGVPADGRRGDFLVRVSIDIPQKLSRSARKIIEDLKNEGL